MQSDSTAPAPAVEYRPIVGFPGYRVGDDGSVWSRWKKALKGYRLGLISYMSDSWRKLALTVTRYGYHQVMMTTNGKEYAKKVHRLVLEAFVGPCPKGMECCHNDGNRLNNIPSNLRWDTRKANAADTKKHGNRPCYKGENHPLARLTEAKVRSIRQRHSSGQATALQLSSEHGVSIFTIFDAINQRTWKHVTDETSSSAS